MSTDVALRDDFALPTIEAVSKDLAAIRAFQQLIQEQLKDGHDYGKIPDTGGRATLLKPGAEKITKLLGLAEQYDIESSIEDWDKPLFRYLIRCRLVAIRTGQEITQGFGECNSMESKYRWRNRARVCPQCQAEAIIKGKQEFGGGWLCYKAKGGCGAKWSEGAAEIEEQAIGRIPNDDVYSQVNTILKMAKKRALVDAALSVGRLSDLFTQDLEDEAGDTTSEGGPTPRRASARQQPRTASQPVRASSPGLVERAITELGFQDAAEVLRALGCENITQVSKMYGTTQAAWDALVQAVEAPVRPPGASTEASEEGFL